jgi:hypothetical protein
MGKLENPIPLNKAVNFIKPSGLFATPDSVEALNEYIEGFSKSEKASAYVVSGMTWNLCASRSNEAITNLADSIEETLACFEHYTRDSHDSSDQSPLAEAHELLKEAARSIADMRGE